MSTGRHTITIGGKRFPSKSKALAFYSEMLNSYRPQEEVIQEDYDLIMALLTEPFLAEDQEEENGEQGQQNESQGQDETSPRIVETILVDYHPFYKTTKCFQLVINGQRELISLRYLINGMPSDLQLFRIACRNTVKDCLREYKKTRFKNRPVHCALTGEVVEWEECNVDHKAPLTFSVIVKSFVVAKGIDLGLVEYTSDDECLLQFQDASLKDAFVDFHRQMAVLRILSTKKNMSVASLARVKPSAKDGVLVSVLRKETSMPGGAVASAACLSPSDGRRVPG